MLWQNQPMVYRENARKDFSERLGQACDSAKVRRRGRAVDIQKMLKGKGITASTTAIGKWLNGDSVPDLHNMLALSECLGVNAAWLEYGEGPIRPGDSSEGGKVIAALTGSPRSRAILHSLTTAAAEGRLSDQDLELLDAIAQRLAHADSAQSTPMNQGHQKLRSKLQHDPVPDV